MSKLEVSSIRHLGQAAPHACGDSGRKLMRRWACMGARFDLYAVIWPPTQHSPIKPPFSKRAHSTRHAHALSLASRCKDAYDAGPPPFAFRSFSSTQSVTCPCLIICRPQWRCVRRWLVVPLPQPLEVRQQSPSRPRPSMVAVTVGALAALSADMKALFAGMQIEGPTRT